MANPHLFAKMKLGSMQNKQAAQTVKKALEEDPTVFQYDEVYDDMARERTEKKEMAKADRNPKYIHELMKTAERRTRENERRIEKQVQKDLEKEGDKYKDKEAFVTSAYKKKMEELRLIEEEEKRQDAIDDMTDVTKQQDLSGFYRHLYRSTMDEPGKAVEPSSSEIKKTATDSSSESKASRSKRRDSDDEEDDLETKVPPSGRRSISPEEKRKSARRNSDSHDHHRSAEKERSSSHRHHHHRDYRERSRSRDRDREHHSRRDSDRHRDRDRIRDKRDNRDRDDRHPRDHHRGDHEKRRDNTSHRDRSHRYHPYPPRRDRDHHGRNREDRVRSRSPPPPTRKEHPKSSTTQSGKIESSKENFRPSTSTSKTKPEEITEPPKRLSEHPVWKIRTTGQVLDDARERYLERKKEGLVRAIVVKEK